MDVSAPSCSVARTCNSNQNGKSNSLGIRLQGRLCAGESRDGQHLLEGPVKRGGALRLYILAVVDQGGGISRFSIKFLRLCDTEKKNSGVGLWKSTGIQRRESE